MGARLGGVAHLGELRRLHVGSFTLDEARTLADIEKDPDAAVLTPAVAMRDLEQVSIDAEQSRAVAHGVTFPAAVFAGANAGPGPFAVLGPDGDLLAVYERRRAAVKPSVVLAPVEAT
jgi:tRNA pseudouridine55 synthase